MNNLISSHINFLQILSALLPLSCFYLKKKKMTRPESKASGTETSAAANCASRGYFYTFLMVYEEDGCMYSEREELTHDYSFYFITLKINYNEKNWHWDASSCFCFIHVCSRMLGFLVLCRKKAHWLAKPHQETAWCVSIWRHFIYIFF